MAKKSSGMKVVMSGLRHTNLQTISGTASVEIAEAISNPAYLESNPNQRQGMLLERVRVFMETIDPVEVGAGASHTISHQITTGDNEGTPALVEPSDAKLVMHAATQVNVSTGVGFNITRVWPVELESVMGLPLIVTPKLTVTHDFDYNSAAYQNKDVYTIIDYSIVSIPAEQFSTLLLNQSRVS